MEAMDISVGSSLKRKRHIDDTNNSRLQSRRLDDLDIEQVQRLEAPRILSLSRPDTSMRDASVVTIFAGALWI